VADWKTSTHNPFMEFKGYNDPLRRQWPRSCFWSMIPTRLKRGGSCSVVPDTFWPFSYRAPRATFLVLVTAWSCEASATVSLRGDHTPSIGDMAPPLAPSSHFRKSRGRTVAVPGRKFGFLVA
jgi:hypothetical protein